MNRRGRRGFALLAVLWLIVALTGVAAGTLAMVRTGNQASRNRVIMVRAGWAREACLEILHARWLEDSSLAVLDTIDLGRGTWCTARASDPAARINLNLADSAALGELFDSDSLTGSLLRYRVNPLESVAELEFIQGFDRQTIARIAPLVTVAGDGRINVNAANGQVLRAGSNLPGEAVAVILARRAASQPVNSLDELLSQVSPSTRSLMRANYAGLARNLIFGPNELDVSVTGGVAGSPITAHCQVTAVPASQRLAIVRRRCA